MPHIRPGIVDHYFISPIQIVRPIPSRQGCGKHPSSAIQVNKLMPRDVIICFDVGQVIIIHPVISRGAPIGLTAYVDTDIYLCVAVEGSKRRDADQKS